MLGKTYEFQGTASNATSARDFARRLPLNSTDVRRRVALCTSLAAILFLTTYLVLHALHVASLDPPVIVRLSRVPFFANLAASGSIGLVGGIALGSSARRHESILRN